MSRLLYSLQAYKLSFDKQFTYVSAVDLINFINSWLTLNNPISVALLENSEFCVDRECLIGKDVTQCGRVLWYLSRHLLGGTRRDNPTKSVKQSPGLDSTLKSS